jgi:hypothetical protein
LNSLINAIKAFAGTDWPVTLWRFLLALSVAGWWGALTFYGLVVVPAGTDLLGSQTQGLVTQQVTRTLNLLGVGLIVSLFFEFRRRSTPARWWVWGTFALCQAGLFAVHVWLSGLLESHTQPGFDWPHFYNVHRIYLIITAVQWGCGPWLLWSLLRSWGRQEIISNV